MNQKLKIRNTVDEQGLPCGGTVQGVGMFIDWQDGPMDAARDDNNPSVAFGPVDAALREKPGHNGAFVEGVITAAKSRLEFYQSSRFACDENAAAILALQHALEHLEARTLRRIQQGTEGTHKGS